jgi:hypothetical protein
MVATLSLVQIVVNTYIEGTIMLKKIFASLFFFIFTASSYALDNKNDYTLHLTIVNHSTSILHFAGFFEQNLGNIFTLNVSDILPGGSAIVTGTTTPMTDLTGILHFTDSAGNTNLLTIIDPRQFHISLPTFILYNDYTMTILFLS